MAKDTLTGLRVKHAMRKQLVMIQPDDTIDCCIQYLTKYKSNALLVGVQDETPVGVVSKTDVMGAWYAGMPLNTPIEMIMNSPPFFCYPDDTLDAALNVMKDGNTHRLYVLTPDTDTALGVLAYPDIVGLLYHYCSRCEQGLFNKVQIDTREGVERYQVQEIMTTTIESCLLEDTLETAVEILSASRVGAILVSDKDNYPKGVISKTDIILCYRHGDSLEVQAHEIMSTPVAQIRQDMPVESAIKTMILKDIHRIFVVPRKHQPVTGIISLSDAARLRSGSCHACISSRIKVEGN